MKKMVSRMTYGAAALSAAMSVMPVWCIGDIDIYSIVGKILGYGFTVVGFVGVFLLFFGAVQWIMAFKNEDAESKNRAAVLVVISIVLIALKTLLSPLFTEIGITVIMPT